jgi:hypothetical protein
MSFPAGTGIDTKGDFSGAAYNTDGSAKIEWAALLNSIISGGVVQTNANVTINAGDFGITGVTPVNGTLPITAIGPTTVVSGSFTKSDTGIHAFAGVSTPCGSKITVVAKSTNNAAGVLVGGPTPAYPLYAGQSVTIAVNDLENVYYQFGNFAGDEIYFIQSA